MNDCVFCKIINGELPSDKLYEDDDFIIIKDIEPAAKVHLLCILKKHFKYLSEASESDFAVIGKVLNKVSSMQSTLGITNDNYRVVINQGDLAGQTVGHLHIHILSGEKLTNLGSR